ncbi:MAG: hypothetical protein FJ125_08780 [Deltaproteobacteria bacterium]|nr:hypothetical protein [Deltaproteobacteria bacterium]
MGCGCTDPAADPAPPRGSPPEQPPAEVALQITEPVAGLRTSAAAIPVAGLVLAAPAGSTVEVGGVVVPVVGERFFAPAVPLLEGSNRLQAVHHPSGARSEPVDVLRDSLPPELRITGPAPGTQIEDPACPVLLTATATDPSGLASLLLAGLPLPVPGSGTFQRELTLGPGLHRLVAEATDKLGNVADDAVHVLCGPFAPPDRTQPAALQAFAGHQALLPIAGSIAAQLDRTDLSALATAHNPLYASETMTIRIVRIVLAPGTEVALTPLAGVLRVALHLNALQIEVEVQGKVQLRGTISLEGAALEGELQLGLRLDGSGSLDARFSSLSLDMNGLRLGVDEEDDLLQALGSYRETVERALESKLAELIAEALPPLVADAFLGLLAPLPLEVLGLRLTLRLLPEEVSIVPLGLHLASGVQLQLEGAPSPLPSFGFVATPGGEVALPATSGLMVSASDDLLNLVLHEAWRARLLEVVIDQPLLDRQRIELELVAGFLGSLLAGLTPAVDPEAPVVLRTRALLPPIIALRTADEFPLRLSLGDLLVEVLLPGPTERLLLALAITLKVGVQARAESGSLQLRLGELTVQCHAIGGEAAARARTLLDPAVGALVAGLQPLLDSLVAFLPLPELAGLTVAKAKLTAEGPQGSYLSLWAALQGQ